MEPGIEHIDASALLRCGTATRDAVGGHATLESAARALTRCFYEVLRSVGPGLGDAGTRGACALVRCYKTHPFGTLPDDLQREARHGLAADEQATPGMRCVSLLASAGDEPAWNTRTGAGGGRRAVPLPSPEALARWPMIERLVRDFGLEAADVIEPPEDAVRLRRGRNFGIFHVEEALGNPIIPAQETFVRAHGIRSVVGFGGSLSTGDVFAIVIFWRVHVPLAVAEEFRALAIRVKSAFFGFGEREAFEPDAVEQPVTEPAAEAGGADA